MDDSRELLRIARQILEREPKNAECYRLLGDYYREEMPEKAFLYYEQALLYSDDSEQEKYLRESMQILEKSGKQPSKVSIIIPSYNAYDYLILCIKGIRETLLETSYELIIVDNASTDERVLNYLETLGDVQLIKNTVNKGFSGACNQGAKAAAPGNALLILNNDAILLPNSLLYLRMALLEKNTAAVSCMTNYAGNGQVVRTPLRTFEDAVMLGKKMNLPAETELYEEKLFLIAFALLIKRDVWEEVGGFDEAFGIGYCEDNDLSYRILAQGYHLLLAHNSFCVHIGNASFGSEMKARLMKENEKMFEKKWGFHPRYAGETREDIALKVNVSRHDKARVLEIGCGLGATLAYLRYRFPEMELFGYDKKRTDVNPGERLGYTVYDGTFSCLGEMPFEEAYFDFILIGDVGDREKWLSENETVLKKYLRENGLII